ncbi:MAG: radical SAM protein [Thermoplasmata archaeon]|nr:radical SAM protein [Thermoplasmata archaeon]
MREIYLYKPGVDFPPVSVTGEFCSLKCKHCSAKYLKGMLPAKTGDDLLKIASEVERAGGAGLLLSGGSSPLGAVMFKEGHLRAVRWIKDNTNLIINLHPGLMKEKTAEEFASAGVDVVSLDIVGSAGAIREVFGLKKTPEDYFSAYRMWRELGVEVVPHITVGLNCGKDSGEEEALQFLTEEPPRSLVFLGFMPTRGTPFESCPPAEKNRILWLIERSRRVMKDTDVLLGCMRPREHRGIEIEAVERGASGIATPHPRTGEELLRRGYSVKVVRACCAVHSLLKKGLFKKTI